MTYPAPPLPPFDPSARCPKCAGADVQVTFCMGGWDCTPSVRFRVKWGQEHLHRRCQRCSYDWPEAPIDDGGSAE